MPQLPNSERAVLDIRKLEDYCLNPSHPRGRRKARIFNSALAIGRLEAAWLRQYLLASIRDTPAAELRTDIFGSRWQVDVAIERQGRTGMVRTIWMIRTDENTPRFVTCWLL